MIKDITRYGINICFPMIRTFGLALKLRQGFIFLTMSNKREFLNMDVESAKVSLGSPTQRDGT